MPSVIDSLIVTLGLDASGFNKGQKDAKKQQGELNSQEKKIGDERKRRAKEVDDQNKKMVEGINKVRNAALALFAVFTVGKGIKDFVSDTLNQAAALSFLSKNLRMSAQDLTAWQRASERANGSAGGILAQLKESADQIAQLKTGLGPSEGMQWFFRYGGNTDDLKDGNTYLLARARIVKQLFDQDPAKAALVAQSMGISDDQFDLIKQGPEAIQKLVDAQRKHAAITDQDAKKAQELKEKWLNFRDAMQSTATKLVLSLMPAFNKLTDWIERLAEKLSSNKDAIAEWVERQLNKVLPLLDEFTNWLQNGGWDKFVNGAKELGSALGEIVNGLRDIIKLYKEWSGAEDPENDGHDPIGNTFKSIGKAINGGLFSDGAADAGKSDLTTMAKMGLARTMASFGNRKAGEYVRDKTGKDDYLVGPNRTNQVMSTLMKMGWTRAQAAGITASFKQESGLSESARNSSSGAYGLAQWLGPRVADFKAWSGRDLAGSTLDQQLRFFQYEVTEGKEKAAGDKLRGAKTAEEAARIHSQYYERPGKAEANISRRQQLARDLNAQAMLSVPAGAAYSARAAAPGVGGSKSELNIENLNIMTQATDAKGIAQAMPGALSRYGYVVQANSGQG